MTLDAYTRPIGEQSAFAKLKQTLVENKGGDWVHILFYILAGVVLLAGVGSLGNGIALSVIYLLMFIVFLFFGIKWHRAKKLNRTTSNAHEQTVKAVSESGDRLVEIINESLKIANESKNPDTKVSRLNVAKDKLEDLKELERKFSFIHITQLDEVESSIKALEIEFETAGYKEIAQGNMNGELLEKEGNIKGAIEVYESLLNSKVDTPFTYRRLAILYRKKKQKDDEVRGIKEALKNIPSSNSKHYQWFAERLAKMV